MTEDELYVVIENTPGYMPEDVDPLVTSSYADACAYADELADRYQEDADDEKYPWIIDRSWASDSNFYAISITSERPHELGRWISVERCEES